VVVTQTKKSADPNLTLTSDAGVADSTFNKSGTVVLGKSSAATGVAIVPAGAQAGKIVVSAGDGTHFQAARFTTAGVLDTTFGGGLVSSDSLLGQAQAVAVVPTGAAVGAVVVAGYVTATPSTTNPALCPAPFPTPAVVEYVPKDGTLNSAFGTGGVATIPCPSQGGRFNGVAIDTNGNIYAAGEWYGTANTPSTLVTAFSASGTTNWSTSNPPVGSKLLESAVGGSQSVANAVALSPNGDVITAGSSVVGGTQKVTVADFSSAGVLQWANAASASGTASAVTVLPNASPVPAAQRGNIVAVGTNGTNFLLAQFNPNGSLYTPFGGGLGLVVNSPVILGASDALRAVSYQPQDHILAVAGSVTTSSQNTNLVVAQYNASNGAPKLSFGNKGCSPTTPIPCGAIEQSLPFSSSGSAVTMDSFGRTIAAGSLPFVNGVTQLGVLRVYGPVLSVPNPVGVTSPRTAAFKVVNFRVSMDEVVFGPVTVAVCATPASTVIGNLSPALPLGTPPYCTTVTFPAGATSENVRVTVRIVVPPGRSQLLFLTASSPNGAFVGLQNKGTIVITRNNV
jgi:uncharacterized delta-60 repeat protein